MGGRGGSSGFQGGGRKYDKNGFLKGVITAPDVNNLQGTEKQIKYAQDIVNNAYRYFNARLEALRDPTRSIYGLFGIFDKMSVKEALQYRNDAIGNI